MKNYLITGATSGIGEACTRVLASEESNLIIVGRNTEKLDELAKELPGNVYPICYDLNDLENIKSIYQICIEKNFKLDGMVYSAGMDGSCPIKMNSISLMKQMMDINCFAYVELAKFFYSKKFSNDGASIVAISSIASLTSEVGMASYCASKAALNSVVKTMAKEYVRRKIRVNAILPGGVDTPMAEKKGILLAGLNDDTVANGSKALQPLGNISCEAIAMQVKYLLSEQAMYMTGELITVSGGRSF